MKNTAKFLSLIIILILFSCSNEPINEAINGSQDFDIFSRAIQSSVPVLERPGGYPDGDFLEIKGASSTIHRNSNGITVSFKTVNLIPNNAYTLWFVVFGDAPGPPNVTYAAGHIAGGSGIANFSSHKSVGSSFNNPLTAEVHLVLHTHGPAQPGIIEEQIHTQNDQGCINILPSGPGRIWPDSDEVGYCADIQVAMHPAVN